MRNAMIVALAGLALAATPAAAKDKDPNAPKEASIPFANHGGIYNYEADGQDAIYIQDRFMHWYRGTFIGPCIDLPFANAIGYQVDATDSFDRFGAIIVRDQRCQLSSLVASGPPPKKEKKKKG